MPDAFNRAFCGFHACAGLGACVTVLVCQRPVEKIEEQFKKLAPLEQAEALERLTKTVYGEDEESLELIETLNRRLAQVETGALAGTDAFAVLDELRAKHSGSSPWPTPSGVPATG